MHKYAIFFCSCALIFLVSCLTLEQTCNFDRNGNCIVSWNYAIPADALPALQQGQQQLQQLVGAEPALRWPTEQSIRQQLKEIPGTELRQFRQFTDAKGITHAEVVILTNKPEKLFPSKLCPIITYTKNASGTSNLSLEITPPRLTDAQRNQLQYLLKDVVLSMKIVAPKAIITSRGLRPQDNTVVWTWRMNPGKDEFPIIFTKPCKLNARW